MSSSHKCACKGGADEADDTYAVVMKNQHDSKHAQDQKESNKSSSHCKDTDKISNWQSNKGCHSMTYHHFVKSNISGCDSYHTHQDNNQHSLGRNCNDDHQNNITQTEIATATAKATTMPTKIIKVIDVTVIITRDAKEATVMMAGKEEITIML
eukprot:2039316-Ditylum_brightwellii.AAC.1